MVGYLTQYGFDIRKKLGSGRYGDVYLATDTSRKACAVKEMTDENSYNNECDIFYILSNHPSPYVPTIFNRCFIQTFSAQKPNRYLLSMTYCPGGSLHDLMEHLNNIKKLMSLNMVTFYLLELVGALDFLHSLLILHQDIKPRNILISESGHIKVTDFGLAARLPSRTASIECNIYSNGLHMPPEVRRNHYSKVRESVNQSVDWFSSGVAAFRLLTGRYPPNVVTSGDSLRRIIANHCLHPLMIDLLSRLMEPITVQRLGHYADTDDVLSHPFFHPVNSCFNYNIVLRRYSYTDVSVCIKQWGLLGWWKKILAEQLLRPPFIPTVHGVYLLDANYCKDWNMKGRG